MLLSARIEKIQARFREAAENRQGLTLSIAEVALLASLEAGSELETTAPLPMGSNADNYTRALSMIDRTCPFTFIHGDTRIPMVWSLFLEKLQAWMDCGEWEFQETQIIIPHTTGVIRLPIDPKHYGKAINS